MCMRYRCALVEGGTYFFTANLVERPSQLLLDPVNGLREIVRSVKRAPDWPYSSFHVNICVSAGCCADDFPADFGEQD